MGSPPHPHPEGSSSTHDTLSSEAAADIGAEHVPLMTPMSMATPQISGDRTRVLVAVDESEECIGALSWAIDNLLLPPGHDKCSDILVLLHVQSHPQMLVGPVGAGEFNRGVASTINLIACLLFCCYFVRSITFVFIYFLTVSSVTLFYIGFCGLSVGCSISFEII